MENFTGNPRLPENPIRYKSKVKEPWEIIFIDLAPLWILLSLPVLYWLGWLLRNCCYFMIFKLHEKCKKVNCSTHITCKDKSKECDFCEGTCTCTHKVTEV